MLMAMTCSLMWLPGQNYNSPDTSVYNRNLP
jgi:hypothetical protein